jgi:Tol biopolymer transport system component
VDEAVRSTIRSADATISQVPSAGVGGWIQQHKTSIAAVALGLIITSAIGFGLYKVVTRPKEFGAARMAALTTGGKISGEDINGQVSISPDGNYVVCSANDSKQHASLWIRQVSTNSLARITPPENGAYLSTTFSPDGLFIYYVASLEKNGFVPTLYRISFLGGTPVKILDRVFSAIGFSKDGKQFAFVRRNEQDMALMVANTDGSGQPRPISVRKQPDGFSTSGPTWAPDGKRIACGMLNATGAVYSTVVEVPIEGGEPKTIGSEKWANVGRVIWLADGSGLIMTAQPEVSSLGTQIWYLPYPSGQARRITSDLNAYGEVSLGVTADSGTIATIQQISASGIWTTAPGEDETFARQVGKTNLAEVVGWAPDGKIVYSTRTGENWDIWIMNGDGSEPKQLTADTFIDQQPSVSGDGRYIVFQSNRSGGRNIWRIDADGNNPKQLTDGNNVDSYPVCSSDGRFVIFMSLRSGSSRIWKVGIEGGPPVQLSDRPGEFPIISPDGKLVAYFFSDEQANAQPKLSIVPFEGGAPVKTIDLPRSVQPIAFAWMPDGRSIAYLDNSSGILNVWSQTIDGGARKQLTNFKSDFMNSFAVYRDGRIATYRFSITRDIVLIKDYR